MYRTKIKAFAEVESFSAEKQFEQNVKKFIEDKSKEYILGVDEEEFKEYVVSKYSVEPLTVYKESEQIDKPTVKKEKFTDRVYRDHQYEKDVYCFTIRYKFSGSPVLFKIRPSSWTMTTYEISINESSREVTLLFKIYEQDAAKFKIEKANIFYSAFTNLANVNVFANNWNSKVVDLVNRIFKQTKEKFLKENDFFSAINISTNSETESIFTVPSIKKAIIPQPKVDKGKEFSSTPTMAKEMYSDILKVIYDAGKSMEKKPALYKG